MAGPLLQHTLGGTVSTLKLMKRNFFSVTFSVRASLDGAVACHHHLKAEGRKRIALAGVELALKLNPAGGCVSGGNGNKTTLDNLETPQNTTTKNLPVQTKRMEEGTQSLFVG